MTTKMIAPALAAVMLAASSGFFAAHAVTNKKGRQDFQHYEQCQAMADQFDQFVATHDDATNVASATMARKSGLEACSNNQFLRGQMLLQQALDDVGLGQPSNDVS